MTRLRVMLVDDEPFILEGLTVLIDWEKEGCVIVKTASNGQEAYEYLKENEVDLIIADIKMPVMTGLELLERIRTEKISDAYFAILSGYNDFSYAKKAIHYACMEYMVKPVGKDNLLELLSKTIKKKELVVQERARQKTFQRSYLVQNLSALIRGKGGSVELEYVKDNMAFSKGVRYVQIVFENQDSLSECSDNEMWEIQELMYDNCKRFLKEDEAFCIKDSFGSEGNYDISLLYCSRMALERFMTLEQFMEALLAETGKQIGISLNLLVGKEVDDVARISNSYSSACVLKAFQGFRQQKKIYYYEEEVQMNQNKVVLCKQSLDRLIQSVEQNDRIAINSSVDELYAEMENMGMSADVITMNTNYLLFQLIHLAVEQDESVDQEEVMLYISNNSVESDIVRGGRTHLRRFACEYAEYLIQLRKNVSRGVLLDVEREVRENFAENLTLKDLSKKYYVNSSYLGQIFRKKYGQSFKDYLSNYRINEAAQLLLKTDKKISLIAEEVGYHDTDYFISRFIEQKGCTPAKYRKSSGEVEK